MLGGNRGTYDMTIKQFLHHNNCHSEMHYFNEILNWHAPSRPYSDAPRHDHPPLLDHAVRRQDPAR